MSDLRLYSQCVGEHEDMALLQPVIRATSCTRHKNNDQPQPRSEPLKCGCQRTTVNYVANDNTHVTHNTLAGIHGASIGASYGFP